MKRALEDAIATTERRVREERDAVELCRRHGWVWELRVAERELALAEEQLASLRRRAASC